MTAVQKKTAKEVVREKLASLRKSSEKKTTEKTSEKAEVKKAAAKVVNIASKLGKKDKAPSLLTSAKERADLAAVGIEAVFVGSDQYDVRIDNDLVVISLPEREDAIAIALGLYAHMKKMAKVFSEDDE